MTAIDPPSAATLKKYGLSEEEWMAILLRQGGVCAICKLAPTPSPKTGKTLLNVDHEHVKLWKKMPPEKRKLYVRALLCWQCNRFRMFRGATKEYAYNMYKMLEEYEERKRDWGLL